MSHWVCRHWVIWHWVLWHVIVKSISKQDRFLETLMFSLGSQSLESPLKNEKLETVLFSMQLYEAEPPFNCREEKVDVLRSFVELILKLAATNLDLSGLTIERSLASPAPLLCTIKLAQTNSLLFSIIKTSVILWIWAFSDKIVQSRCKGNILSIAFGVLRKWQSKIVE